MLRAISSISLVSVLALAAGTAAADPRSSSSVSSAVNATPVSAGGIPDPSAPVCAPACRAGFTCLQGACVSACNPGCGDGEQCTSDGQCVAKTIAPKRTAIASPPPVVAPAAPAPTEPDADAAPSLAKVGIRTHDGFYMRLAMGPSYFNATWKGGSQDATVTGVGAGLELAFGGTPVSGLVIGGGISSSYVSSPTISYAGQSADSGSASLTLAGPFFDWYPSATQGFHLQGSAGVAYASYADKSGGNSVSGTGFGMTAGIGYEVWVGEQWSFGGILRLQYATPSIKADGMTTSVDTSTVVPALLIGATYH
jgi:hypothetical protein